MALQLPYGCLHWWGLQGTNTKPASIGGVLNAFALLEASENALTNPGSNLGLFGAQALTSAEVGSGASMPYLAHRRTSNFGLFVGSL